MLRRPTTYYNESDFLETSPNEQNKKPFLKKRAGLMKLMRNIENAQAIKRASNLSPPPRFQASLQDNIRDSNFNGHLPKYTRSSSYTSIPHSIPQASYTRQGSLTRETRPPPLTAYRQAENAGSYSRFGGEPFHLQDTYRNYFPYHSTGAFPTNNSKLNLNNGVLRQKEFGMGGESYIEHPGLNSDHSNSLYNRNFSGFLEQSRIKRPNSRAPPINTEYHHDPRGLDKYEPFSSRTSDNRTSSHHSLQNLRHPEISNTTSGRSSLLKPTKFLSKKTNLERLPKNKSPLNAQNLNHDRRPSLMRRPSFSHHSGPYYPRSILHSLSVFPKLPLSKKNHGPSLLKRNASLIRAAENRPKVPISPSIGSVDAHSSAQSTIASVSNYLKEDEGTKKSLYPLDNSDRSYKKPLTPEKEELTKSNSTFAFLVSILLILILVRVCFHINGRLIEHDI